MKRFTPLEKQSKRAQKEYHAKQRGTWNGLNPVTRIPPKPNAYNRAKARSWKKNSGSWPSLLLKN